MGKEHLIKRREYLIAKKLEAFLTDQETTELTNIRETIEQIEMQHCMKCGIKLRKYAYYIDADNLCNSCAKFLSHITSKPYLKKIITYT
jgi:hypothetical protein